MARPRPGRDYWYRFRAGSELSPVGRTRTAPAADTSPDQVRFAYASCQNYADGYFTAYRLADEDVDLVVQLGDYIYDGGGVGGEVFRARPDLQLYRRLRYGTLADFNVVDTRQYATTRPAATAGGRRGR
nr:alkaline phosphatase D family protein [Jiangella alba]